MASVQGPKIIFTAEGERILLNCPIKKIIMLKGNGFDLYIDGVAIYMSVGREVVFPPLFGYPGADLRTGTGYSGSAVLLVEEIGDVLNPNYFNEDIGNWNGQSEVSSVETQSTETAVAAPARTRSRKAEVKE